MPKLRLLSEQSPEELKIHRALIFYLISGRPALQRIKWLNNLLEHTYSPTITPTKALRVDPYN